MKLLRRPAAPAARPTRPTRPTRPGPTKGPSVAQGFNFSNLTEGIRHFVYDTRSELRKVIWPTREQTINLTGLVIGVSLAVAVFIGVVDSLLQKMFQLILGT